MQIHRRLKNMLLFLSGILMITACNLSNVPMTPTPQPTVVFQQEQIPLIIPETNLTPQATLATSFDTGATGGTNPQSGCPIPPGWFEYTIAAGDSLGLLAEATGTTITDLQTQNCLENPDAIFSGQIIYLPSNVVDG